ncbi:DUF929 domain-containing protein [Ktedonosporobacter rubrisoli]|uniref:DUF929 domain-containing protein n=1 Tax=Ktedonosporobacter rubrisoli TaxID=2509675 RepID=A0A4P6JHN3_KTERU|nr:DUF929 family protein [Ktedonosporobacter rubrisoli]QBD74534.1 DUF929 domain-containing protein [Ktedonosporobacter rubrisoli]
MSKAKRRKYTQPKNAQQRLPKSRRTKSQRHIPLWSLIGAIMLIVSGIVGLFVFMAHQQDEQLSTGSSVALKAMRELSSSTISQVGQGIAQNSLHTLTDTPTWKSAAGKPVFLYVGAEYCPFCAAQRWAVITALSRFGTLSSLTPLLSAEEHIPSFTFHGASYTSQYLDLQAIETEDNAQQPLDSLTAEQQQMMKQYDRPPYVEDTGKIPFIDIANQHVSLGAYFSPEILQNHSYQDIAGQLKDPHSQICKAIVGAANLLTAAICHTTGNQPASACSIAPIPDIQNSLALALSNQQSLAQSGSTVAFPFTASLPRQIAESLPPERSRW